jgi:opacity protein-like surface antigen
MTTKFFYNKFLIVCIGLFLFGFSDASAQLLGTIGGSVGNGFHNKELKDINGEDFKFDENNFAWKVFAATNWKFIGLEGGYRDFGKVESNTNLGKITSSSRGGDIYATGTIKFLKILAAFAKAGAYFGRTKTEFFDQASVQIADETERQTSFAWGLGAGLNLGMLHVRLEYENMHINEGNLGMLSLGAGINLNKRE